MSTVRIVLNSPGIRQVALTSPEVRALIHSKAQAVANAVNDPSVPVRVHDGGVSRARSTVALDSPVGALIESRDRLLGTALDAAKG